jgi:predicted lipid-binding transport protein (Tim44 family)
MPTDIIILAVIAIVLGVKLFSLFGQKRDMKRKKFESQGCGGCGANPTAPLKSNIKEVELKLEKTTDPLVRIKLLCPSFEMEKFLKESKNLYRTILKLYAEGNTQELSELINIEMMQKFAYKITQREDAELSCKINVLKIKDAVVSNVSFENETLAKLQITFSSETIHYITDKKNRLRSGNKTRVDKRKDIWTFSSDLRTAPPTWKLVAVNQLF